MCLQTDSKTVPDAGVQKTWLWRCLPHIKYLFAALLIPPFLNYVALLQESSQLMPPGDHLSGACRFAFIKLDFEGVLSDRVSNFASSLTVQQ